ncbi:RNA polymerase sigma factor, sigma-70 family [Rubidibacter lacunae KORDI 51-2]|uniref:RNA polymerase sigma factor, sigma-70 family n=1 Tax=Rubidibacter lacunae KORDI 51-2 TaxID=582515 RepID=U5DGX2_9CHRO|nr:sigma-70 family RNA polymerase sigma factor [Rubidibacter lacunae]ERN40512.1 RNA polymerase sigma factor, sigma-70 family [Rubidibacter lacunae KORDI 51-2]
MLAEDRTQASDRELVRRCQQGDTDAFRHLYRRHQQKVRSLLYQLCGGQVLDDLVQEVFLRAWKGLPKMRQAATFSTWLYRISWNVASDQRRKFALQRRDRAAIQSDRADVAATEAPDLMQLHHRELVQQGLDALAPEQRLLILLHEIEDVPHKEISKILGIPIGTVKSRLFYARRALREYLQQQGVYP